MNCEVSKSTGYDPTGEWAVECGAEGEFCERCEIIVCPRCHAVLAEQHDVMKKLPVSEKKPARPRRAVG